MSRRRKKVDVTLKKKKKKCKLKQCILAKKRSEMTEGSDLVAGKGFVALFLTDIENCRRNTF